MKRKSNGGRRQRSLSQKHRCTRALARSIEALEARRLLASVYTDYSDYAFGSTAMIVAVEFAPHEPVQFQATHLEGTPGSNDDPENAPWIVNADADGNVNTTWSVTDPDALNATYLLMARGLNSGLVATTVFTDSVAVTPASGGTNISADRAANAALPQYTTLGNIVIGEPGNGKQDIAPSQTNATLILSAPAGWEFKAATGSVSFASGNNITAATISVTTSIITVTFSTNAGSMSDTLTISGIQVRSLDGAAAPSSANIVRSTANPGTAVISGITNNVTNFGTLSQVRGAATRYTISAPESSVVGQPVTVTVTAFDQFDNVATGYTGTVRFTSTDTGATLPANYTFVAGDNGVRTFSNGVTLKSAGGHTVTVTDTVNAAVVGSFDVEVAHSATTTTMASSANPTLSGESITFTATVSAVAPGGGTASGTVSFYDDDTLLGVGTLNASGVATYTTSALDRGSRSITAVYEGDANYLTSTSAALVQAVNNRAPVANPQSITTNEDAPVSGAFAASDPESDPLTYVIVAHPSNGTITSFNADTGEFTYTPNPDYFGADSFTFKVNDGTMDSATAMVSITVNAVNDAPTFTKGSDRNLLEDAGAQSISGWATNISRGPANEAAQTVSFLVSNDNNALFAVQPAISATGTLTFTPAANANGTATVTVQIKDSGGAANGGVDTSVAETFTITLTPVNDAPSFTKGANQTVAEDAGAQTVSNWATSISKGPANESSQTVEFLVSNNNNALFAVQPSVSSDGTLSYTPAADANGVATVTVQIKDNGGTANGGVDTSAVQTFTITINAVNDAPVLNTASTTLPAINEDDTTNTGVAVSTLIAGLLITDVDAGAVKGIAVIAADSANGAWQYSINSGTNWTTFTPSAAAARLLADSAATRIRFIPNANFNGIASFTFRAWDQSTGANGGSADASTNGGITAFSSASAVATITINPVNDAPVLGNLAANLPAIDEDHLTNSGVDLTTLIAGLNVTEVDAAALKGIAVTSVNNTNGTWQYSTDGGDSWTAFGGPSTTASRLLADSASNRIRFVPNANYNGPATFTYRAWDQTSGADGGTANTTTTGGVTAFSTASGTATITVNPVNDAPVVTLPGSSFTYASGTAPAFIDAAATVSDVDMSVFAGGTLTISFAANGSADDQLAINNEGNGTGKLTTQGSNVRIGTTVVGTFTGGAGTTPLVITFNANATTAIVQQVLRNITFANDAGIPSTLDRTVSVVLTDGAEGTSAAVTKTIAVTDSNDAPVLGNVNVTLPGRVEDDGGPNEGLDLATIVAALNITDADGATALQGIAVTAVNNSGGAWQYSLDGGSSWLNFGSVSPSTSRLLSDSALNRIRFVPNANFFGTSTFTFRAWDQTSGSNGGVASTSTSGGATAFSSASGTGTVNVAGINDAPTLNPIANPPPILEDAGTQTINLTGISAGPNESSQQITITAVSSDTAVIPHPTVNYTSGNSTGTLTFTPVANASGSAVITVTVTDNGGTANGGVNTISRTFSVVVTAVNDAPIFVMNTAVTVPDTAGAQSLSGWATLMSAGPADEAGQSLNFLVSNDNNALFAVQPTIGIDGTLSFTPNVNVSGVATVTVQLQDDGGTANGGQNTSTQTFTITVNDTTAPPAPVITAYVVDEEEGGSTSDNTIELNGTAEPNSTVRIFDGETLLGEVAANSTGAWNYTTAALPDGEHTFTAVAVDASNNVSPASEPITITIAIIVAETPVITGWATDTGISGDGITSAQILQLTGTAEADVTIRIYDGGTLLGSTTADAEGNWTFSTATFAPGEHSFTATAKHPIGVASPHTAALNVTIDIAPPAAPSTPQLQADSDSGISSSDGITNVNAPTFTGTAEAGSTVTIYANGVAVGSAVAMDGSYAITIAPVDNGTHAITASTTDAAGNISAFSGPLSITVDASAPAAPSAPDLAAGSDSGSSSTDDRTNIVTPLFTGAAESGSTVTIFSDGVAVGSAVAVDGQYSITTVALSGGPHVVTATATDAAGNVSQLSTPLAIVIDTTPPAAPAINAFSSDSGIVGDAMTNDVTPTLNGVAEPHSRVELFEGLTLLGSAAADDSGAWSIAVPQLFSGTYNFTTVATDAAGNVSSASEALQLTIDAIAPDAPVLAAITPDTGASNSDGITSSRALVLSGIAEPGAMITVSRNGVGVIGSTTAGADGLWSFDYSVTLLDNDNYVFSATATDAAGNVSPLSAPLAVTVDAAPPAIVLSGSSGSETDAQHQHFAWNASDNSSLSAVSITVTRDGTPVFSSTDPSGTFDFNATGLGDYQITVSATDTAGNVSSATRSVTVTDDDSTSPTIVLGGSHGSETDGDTNHFTWNISDAGSGLGSISVIIRKDGEIIYQTTDLADAIGSYNFDSHGFGTFTMEVSATDADGDHLDDTLTSTASRSVVVSDDDESAPIITLGGSQGDEDDSENQAFTWNVTDASSTSVISIVITRNGDVIHTSSDGAGSFDFNSFGAGEYQITVSATDADNDHPTDSLSSIATRSVIVTDDDSAAPVIIIGGSEGSETDAAGNGFTWHISDAGSGLGSISIIIRKDGTIVHHTSDLADATGSFNFDGLGIGVFAIDIQAADADTDHTGDTLTSTASRSVTVSDDDAAGPVIVLGSSQNTENDSDDQVFTWDVSDISGLTSVSVIITHNDNIIHTSSDAAGSFDFNSYGPGVFALTVNAVDADDDRADDSAASTSSRSVTVEDDDDDAPSINLGGSEGAQTDGDTNHFTWNISDAASGLAAINIVITRDDGAGAGPVVVYSTTSTADAVSAFNFDALGLGTYTIHITATDLDADRAGDALTATATRTIVVTDDDTAGPVIVLGGSEGVQNDGQNQHFTWNVLDSVSGVASVLVTITKNGDDIHTSTDAAGSFDFNSYGLGDYQINVTATDADDDRADDSLTVLASQSVTVSDDDTAGPVIVLGGSQNNENDGQTQSFSWNITDAGSGLGSISVIVRKNGEIIYQTTDLADAIGSYNFDSRGLGTFSIEVSASDADEDRTDDALTSTASRSVIVSDDDQAAPIITLGGSHNDQTDDQPRLFTWNVADASGLSNITVTIRKNGEVIHASSDAAGSFEFDDHGLGTFSIEVSAADADNDRADDVLTSTATRSVTVTDDDTDAPTIILGGSEGVVTDGDDNTFTWNITDAGSGIGTVSVVVTRDGLTIFSSTEASGSFNFHGLGLSTYQISALATDADQDRDNDSLTNSATRSVTVSDDDSDAPVINLGGSQNSENDGQDQTFTWGATDAGAGIGSVNVVITRNGQVVFSSTEASGSFDFNALGIGTYELSISATDADADRADDALITSATRTIVVSDDDTDAPVIVLGGSQGVQTDADDNHFTWNVTDAGSGLHAVQVVVTRSGVAIHTSSDASGLIDLNAFGPGEYQISVLASDSDNDWTGDQLSSSATRTLIVTDEDSAAPIIVLGGAEGTRTDAQSNAFTWNVTDADSGLASVQVSVTHNGVEIFSSTDATGAFSLDGLPLGAYQLHVTATDADNDHAGDALTSTATRTVNVLDDDIAAPVITLGGSSGVQSHSLTQSFSWSITDASGVAEVSIEVLKDGVLIFSSSDASGSFNFDAFGVGTFEIRASATDNDNDGAGDSLSAFASRTVVVTNTAPVANAGSHRTAEVGQTLPFNGGASSDADGDTLSYTWNFGDGASATGLTATHSYPTSGAYTVTLTVSDGMGGQHSDSATVIVNAPAPVNGLPTGWTSGDIGNTGLTGSASVSNGTWTVKGAGTDIYGSADSFHFAYRQVTGDGTIIARVNSLTNTDANAKAGIMIRESLAPNAKEASIVLTPGGGAKFLRRTATGGSTTVTTASAVKAPYWLKLVRSGTTVSSYYSLNGSSWTLMGTQSISLGNTVYVGLAVTSKKTSWLNTATFSNISLSGIQQQPPPSDEEQPPPPPPPTTDLPTGWSSSGIGNTGLTGSASVSNGTWTVKGAGTDIYGSADSFHFAYRQVTGDGTIIARVNSLTNTDANAKAGIMIRESLAPNAKEASIVLTPGGGAKFLRRTATGGSTTVTTALAIKAPYWLKLVRSGTTVSSYYSLNGSSWTLMGTQSISMGSTVYVGLAVTSKNTNWRNTATFDNVSVTQA